MLEPEVFSMIQEICAGDALSEVSMAEHCSIRAGGRAACIAYPPGREEVERLVEFLRRERIPYLPLGLGTNMLVRDGGFQGVFVSLTKGFSSIETRIDQERDTIMFTVGSGVPLSRLAQMAAREGGRGLESLAGIPGTVGGAIRMNAGPAGSEGQIGNRVVSVEVLERSGKLVVRDRESMGFGYRTSALKEKDLALSAVLELGRGSPEEIQSAMEEVRRRKQETQPGDFPSAGSVFKNPKGGRAGQLIEEAGLKGVRIRGAKVSEIHANFIVNVGEATARDIVSLVGLVRDRVKEKFGVLLELELCIVGEDEGER